MQMRTMIHAVETDKDRADVRCKGKDIKFG